MIGGHIIPIFFHDGILDPPYNPDIICFDLILSQGIDIQKDIHLLHDIEEVCFVLVVDFNRDIVRTIEWEHIER